ncbi:MAG: helix-turn-helix domain-containing protein [Planctomycetota bacterium]|jgi:DNA-binding IclR family transcriptional regulator|nr:helix-turn-helix domain-containing protein [Planctomycetota bacterium]
MESDPAPALSRGLEVLRLLVRDGRCGLERIAADTGYPKTSVLRLLTSLEHAGVVARDPVSKRYHALQRLVPWQHASDWRAAAAAALPALADAVGATAELYRWDATMVMIDRCAPETEGVTIQARVGFERDLRELDALAQIACVWGGHAMPAEPWAYRAGKPLPLDQNEARALLAAAEVTGVARDQDLNAWGVQRCAVPIVANGRLLGAVAVARSWVPDPVAAEQHIATALLASIERIQAATADDVAPDVAASSTR